jgi:hypothetical protein
MNTDGWDSLQSINPDIAEKRQVDKDDIDRLYLRVFASDDGAKLLTHLRSLTIEQPTWYPGEEASHGYAREGQNSLVREIERRMKRARNL